MESIDPDVKVFAVYLTAFGYWSEPDDAPEGAREVAGRLSAAGADVIFHVAGRSGVGVLDAASGLSVNKCGAIGVGADLWRAATTRQRPHILMSIVNRFDVQMYGIIEDHLAGGLEAGPHRLTVTDGMISYVAHGDVLSTDASANVDGAIGQIASGDIRPPRTPTGPLTDSDALLGPGRATASFGDVPVTFTLPDGWTNIGWAVIKGEPIFGLVFMKVDNIYTDSCPSVALDPPVGPTVDDLASAWANLPAFDATDPMDITVDGFVGKLVEFTVPDYDEGDCTYGKFMLLRERQRCKRRLLGPRHPISITKLRILDVDGTRVVIAASWFPDTSAAGPGRHRRDPQLHPDRVTLTDRRWPPHLEPNCERDVREWPERRF